MINNPLIRPCFLGVAFRESKGMKLNQLIRPVKTRSVCDVFFAGQIFPTPKIANGIVP